MLTESTEMHLITVYRLTYDSDSKATIRDIARMLGLHHSSVSEKTKRLEEAGYLTYDTHDGASLTEEGRRIAVNVLRKHRLIKSFLVNMAGYSIDEVYDEACKLEHVITDRLADSLEKLLNYPEVDPHGYPIPKHDGSVAELTYQTLNDFGPGDTVVVRRIESLNKEKITYLRELGLIPNTQLSILEIAPFDGPLTIRVGERTIAIAPSLAQEIEVSVVR